MPLQNDLQRSGRSDDSRSTGRKPPPQPGAADAWMLKTNHLLIGPQRAYIGTAMKIGADMPMKTATQLWRSPWLRAGQSETSALTNRNRQRTRVGAGSPTKNT